MRTHAKRYVCVYIYIRRSILEVIIFVDGIECLDPHVLGEAESKAATLDSAPRKASRLATVYSSEAIALRLAAIANRCK